jgi:recombination protein RecT
MKADGSDQNTKGAAPGAAKPMTDEERARKTMQAQILNMTKEFERALPGKIGVERMMRIVMTAILKTPTLAMCEPTSFMGALLQALQLGLEVNTPLGQAYLIPRKKKDRNGNLLYWECNFQIGYQGLLDLCYRYGKYKMITAEVVYDGDYFDFRYGTKQFLDHRPEGKKGANPIRVWALYHLENGGERFVVWSWDEAMAHGEEFSDSFNKNKPWASPWLSSETAQEEMAKKSVLKALLKYAPKSVEGQIEAAAYADGHAIIAGKFEEAGGNMRLDLDVKQLAPPDPEMQDMMNQINRVGRRPEEEAETVPANRENAGETAQAVAALPPQTGAAAPRSAAASQAAGNGTARRGGALFPADEVADLDGSVEPPAFR